VVTESDYIVGAREYLQGVLEGVGVART